MLTRPPEAESPPEPEPPPPEPDPTAPDRRPVHRLRNLSRQGKLAAAAAAVGLAVLLAPIVAFVHFAPDWVASGDNALIALRVLDVGTDDTPVVGQPSTSGFYGGNEQHVFHPGATHFYLMAPFVRALGTFPGMIVVSVLITGGSALLALWALFRQLGPRVAVLAGVVLAGVMFTTGAASLINPVSSNISGYPLLCSAVLAWCLLCGDDRLLPLTTVVVSFAVQQHLSVGPTMAVLALAAVGGLVVVWRRHHAWRDPGERRRVVRLLGVSGGLALLMWAGPLYQQVTSDDEGNLSALVTFASDSDRPSVGLRAAVHQVVHVLGWPPLLGDTRINGFELIRRPGVAAWVATAVVLAVLVAAAARWRRTAPRRALLVVMVGVLIVCGLLNGSNVPSSVETGRIAFYHWLWPLALLATVALALAVADAVSPLVVRRGASVPRAVPAAALGLALVAMVVPAVVGVGLDRPANAASWGGHFLPRSAYDSLTDQVREHEAELGSPVLVLSRGDEVFDGTREAFSLALVEGGVDVVHPTYDRHYVHNHRLADYDTVGSALVVVTERLGVESPAAVGREIARVELNEDVDREAYEALREQASEATSVVPGPELQRRLDALGPTHRELYEAKLQELVADQPVILADRDWVELLAEAPTVEPALDPALLRRLADSLPEHTRGGTPVTGLSIELVQGEALDRLLDR